MLLEKEIWSLLGQDGLAQRLEHGGELCPGNGAQRGKGLGASGAASGQQALGHRPFHGLPGPAGHLSLIHI